MEVKVRSGFAASVVLASKGYPGSYEKGKAIDIGELSPGKPLTQCLYAPRTNIMIFFRRLRLPRRYAGERRQGRNLRRTSPRRLCGRTFREGGRGPQGSYPVVSVRLCLRHKYQVRLHGISYRYMRVYMMFMHTTMYSSLSTYSDLAY